MDNVYSALLMVESQNVPEHSALGYSKGKGLQKLFPLLQGPVLCDIEWPSFVWRGCCGLSAEDKPPSHCFPTHCASAP
jgi:hypothetical protein